MLLPVNLSSDQIVNMFNFDYDFEGCGFIWMQVAVDIDYHHNMLASHLKVNPKEIIVGWYLLS